MTNYALPFFIALVGLAIVRRNSHFLIWLAISTGVIWFVHLMVT